MNWIFQYLSDSIIGLVAFTACAAIALAAIVMLLAGLLRARSGRDGKSS